MRDSLFFDTNILVYAFDKTDQEKYKIASRLVTEAFQKGNGVISVQVLKEFFVTVTRKVPGKMSVDDAEQTIRDFSVWKVVDTTVPLILKAIEFHKQFDFSFWDAMIVAACRLAGSSALLSEDLSHGMLIENVRIINPFHADHP
ncbi:MAG: PIN domain-containing protein [Desulfovibrionales bacterium]|nr:PIN domain-containing protein [Desulfovibrionales bacterium]